MKWIKIVAIAALAVPCSAQLIEFPVPMDFPVITNRVGRLGEGFGNRFKRVSKDQSLAKVERFRQSATPVILREFLGDKVLGFRVTYFSSWCGSTDVANTLVQRLLRRVILFTGKRAYDRPLLEHPERAEMGPVHVQAVLKYQNGREGILQSDGQFLFVEDSDGTYWWYIWPARISPEKIRWDSGQTNSAANGNQPGR